MKTQSVLTTAVIFAVAVLFAASSAVAQWDVTADFDITSNAAGNVWTYGQVPYSAGPGSDPDVSGFILYDEAGTVVDPNAPFAWQDLAAGSVDTLGAVSFNESNEFKTFFGIDWEPMEVNLVPDQGGTVVSTARFTAPQDGLYIVHAEFADNQDCCAGREGDAWVLTDSATTFMADPVPASDGLLTHATGTQREWLLYDDLISLSAGESIYFASGKGTTGGDHVVLRATVDLVPEPAAFGASLFGLLALLGMRRRRAEGEMPKACLRRTGSR